MPQARKSSIHFAPVTNIKFAVSHSERTELSEPGYLLPKEHQLPNILVDGSLSENELAELFIKQKECMTGQAKARGSSPFWEGVVVLKNTDGEEQSKKLQAWKVAYENATGHKVLHMTIHLDEGYLDKNGKPHYNPHAHVIVSRMNEKNRIIQLKRKQLGEVQDLTAEILQMDRGSTLKERGGKRGRVHIGHKEFRIMANEARLDLEKGNNQKDFYINLLDYKNQQDHINREKIKEANKVIAEKDAEIARLKLEHKAEVEKLKTEYLDERSALKASGEAKQADYQQIKKAHEEKVQDLEKKLAEALEKVAAQASDITQLKQEKTKTLDEKYTEIARLENEYKAEVARLKSEYAAEREELKASGTATQRDYQQLKKDHEAALADLAKARQVAEQVPALVEQLKAAQEQGAKARQVSVAPQAPTPAQARPTTPQPVPHPDTATAYVWPKLTEQQFQALPTRQFGDRVIAAARDVLVMCADLADAAAKHKLFPRQVVRALESLLENYREPPATEPTKPVPEQQPLAAAHARTQTPSPSRGGLGR